MASQATSNLPSTPTKTKSPSSANRSANRSAKGSPKPAQQIQQETGKSKTPRKLKRKVDDTITPAAEKTANPELSSRPSTEKPTARLEKREPEPEIEREEEPVEEEGTGIELEDYDADNNPAEHEEEEEEEEEDDENPLPTSGLAKEQRSQPDSQSEASGSGTSGFFKQAGGLTDFARGLRGATGGALKTVTKNIPLDLSAVKGFQVGDGGKVFNKSGTPFAEVVEGDPEDLVGQTVGDDGEILDEDGDFIGRVDLVKNIPNKTTETLDQVKNQLPTLQDLDGLPVSEAGEIKDKAGNVVGRVVEGDAEDLVGQTLNDLGEILDEEGDLIGRVDIVSPEDRLQTVQDQTTNVREAITDTASGIQNKAEGVKNTMPQLTDLDGLPVSDGGEIKDKAGNVIGKVIEGDPEDLTGQTVNGEGEIVDEDGDLIGRVKVLSPEEAAQKVAGQVDDIKDQVAKSSESTIPPLEILKGKKISKRGRILDEEGDVIGQIADGFDTKDLAGKKPNENGEVLDKAGNVIGKVEVVDGEAADAALQSLQDEAAEAPKTREGAVEEVKQPVEDVSDVPGLSSLDGLDVGEDGKVLDSEGNVFGKLESDNLKDIAGKTVNEKGLVIDDDGNILGRVGLVDANADDVDDTVENAAADAGPELPPLSSLDGLKVNKFGKIVNDQGTPIGELVEGDPKKLSKFGATLDANGQFWDNRGNVIGKAKTLPMEEEELEGPFAGLEGLVVVQDGWVEDENENIVGKLVEGDAKKLVGRAIDEDGDILDKRGNVVGRAERYEQPDAAEPEKEDLSSLSGLTPNKAGNVIGPEGVPVARVVEGNLKEVAGRKIDSNGQVWNDAGKVVGRAELIPEDERETKPEGTFGGLEGLFVNKEGLVEDGEGNVVGKIIEGDAKKLRGRAVDEDGDIVDKYGNVKGHAEPYELPEEEVEEEDLSSLDGKKVNKAGHVVDQHGVVFGRIVDGDPKKMSGRRVDGMGQIWSDGGKVIGRAELIPGAEREKPEGTFFRYDDAKVGKDGVVISGADTIIGRLVEGDPKRLQDRAVDEDGDILDKSGNIIGKAERWEPEEKKRDVNPMAGRKVNKQGEVRDENGDLIGTVTAGNLKNLIGKAVNDNGYVVDNDGNKIGEATLLENMPEEEPQEPEFSQEALEKQKRTEEDKKLAERMCGILQDTLGKIEPVCKQITDLIEKADRTPKDELDEEKLVQDVKPLLEEGGRILQECNGSIRALDPDGRIAATAKARAATQEATPEEYRLADLLKEITQTVVKTIDNGRKRIQDMPHAKKKLNPLWSLLSEPLFQIIAAVGLLLSGVLGLVSRLLDGLGLGGLVRGLLGGLGVDKLLEGLGLGVITESLGFGKKK
ncbi:Adventurous-gliding motility protein Z [Talaromyces islandicus]|uniref:Adventurous-gliding motility protein Z n=1 Tax=Talaromyces islandicus TaxID=28573 RepID=A0A0U1MAR9_TALIS|nr:Adventurous-gliding motility protein Z [Talaromyces islandicus]